MYRTVLIRVFAAVLCLGVTAQPLLARPVKHGALDICASVDNGTVSIVDGTEVCCAHEAGLDDAPVGRYYCVQCDPPGSNNCETWYASKAPGDRVVNILQTSILAEQQGIRKDLIRVLTELDNLQTQIDKGLCTPPVNK